MSHYRRLLFVVGVSLAGLALAACAATPGPAVTPAVSTATAPVAATVAPTSTATALPATVPPGPAPEWQRVEIAEAGLSFYIPAGWEQQSPDWLWAPAGADMPQIGAAWNDVAPGVEIEALFLPNHSQMVNAAPLELSAGQAMSYTLQVFAPAAANGELESVQTHVIVRGAGGRAFDVYFVARTAEELSARDAVVREVLASIETTQ
jgi:hypothetical protein